MNALAGVLFWSAVQATSVAVAALALERWAARRGPRAGSWVAITGLILIAALTPLAFCGLPRCFVRDDPSARRPAGLSSVQGGSPGSTVPREPGSVLNQTTGADSGPGLRGLEWSGILRTARQRVGRWSGVLPAQNPIVVQGWCLAWLAGTAWCMIRLAMGLWGVSDCRRRSARVYDPEMLELVESLRMATGVAGAIEVRELNGLGAAAAATVGWRRPLVLLPPNWRCWNPTELRAVLAHEIAHIARCDYAVGVIAQMTLAFHSYHPLVHWIAARLRLQQELAADVIGAELAGGRREYLLALSRLVLAEGDRRLAWPARTFLPAKGQLIRRIQMLKVEGDVKSRSLPLAGRVGTVAVLAAVGIGALSLRVPALSRADDTLPRPATVDLGPTMVPASGPRAEDFDLSFLPPSAAGFLAIRPAAICRINGIKPQFDKVYDQIRKKIGDQLPAIEAIEQATIEFSIKARDKSKKQPGRLMTGDVMIRTVDDYDWMPAAKLIAKAGFGSATELTEIHFENKTYYKVKVTDPRLNNISGYIYLHDARTLAWTGSEGSVRRIIQGRTNRQPDFLGRDDWRKVAHGLAAYALDTRDQQWRLDVANDDPKDLLIGPLLLKPRRWVLGIDCTDQLAVQAIATCRTERDSQELARIVDSLVAKGRTSLTESDNDDTVRALMRIYTGLLRACEVRQVNDAVEISARTQASTADLARFLTALANF